MFKPFLGTSDSFWPATAGICGWYIQVFQKISYPDTPALAGIYGWYIPNCKCLSDNFKPAIAGIYG